MSKNRPRRGEPGPDVLVSGDTGEYHPQGGARTGADMYRESGDLDAREFGVPQADLPGGVLHVVNPETHPARTAPRPERPADYHKYHGVPSDDGQYEPTPDETTLGTPPRPAPVPVVPDAVPVWIVEQGSARKTRRTAITDTIMLPAVGSDPARICNADDSRDEIMLLCTDSTHDALFSDDRSSLADATATDHGRCAFLSHSATTYTRVATQAELFGTSADATVSHLAIVVITTVPA